MREPRTVRTEIDPSHSAAHNDGTGPSTCAAAQCRPPLSRVRPGFLFAGPVRLGVSFGFSRISLSTAAARAVVLR
jgi:hypothetical protein